MADFRKKKAPTSRKGNQIKTTRSPRFIVGLVSGLLAGMLIISPAFSNVSGGDDTGGENPPDPPPEVPLDEADITVQTGPEFKDTDFQRFQTCSLIEGVFPFDFVLDGNIPSSSVCPQVEFFGHVQQFCWVLDLWHKIEPAFVALLFYQAIVSW